ncbi:hypothetical protein CK203_018991 [Vitis vinifera]|uniref:Uncharacterized protein n=1 Tax=Vitis vinifera TaxID=29760 RepID=A0A438IRF5_VITVI|nr:hypothetical protein CK203_018991 [Vitis vinifera]
MDVTALDRANAEEALLPIPKIFDFHEKNKRYQNSNIDPDEIMADDLMNVRSQNKAVESKEERKIQETLMEVGTRKLDFDLKMEEEAERRELPFRDFASSWSNFFVMLVHADGLESVEASNETSCLEEQLRSLGLLDNKDDLTSNSMLNSRNLRVSVLKKICLQRSLSYDSFSIYLLHQMRAAVSSIIPGDAYELLKSW